MRVLEIESIFADRRRPRVQACGRRPASFVSPLTSGVIQVQQLHLRIPSGFGPEDNAFQLTSFILALIERCRHGYSLQVARHPPSVRESGELPSTCFFGATTLGMSS